MVPDRDRYEITVLESGLTVVSESLPYVHSVALGVWSRAGSRDERAGTEGTAHFLEHMFFKGTPDRSAFDIAYELERLGGYMNAFTSKDHTCFYTRILDTHLDVAMDVLGDMVQHPRLDPEEVEREKSVIQEEIKTAVDTPDDWITELFYRDLYGEHPLAHPVLGSAETVGSLSQEDLEAFIQRRYRLDNLLVAAAGSLEHRRLVGLVEETFTDLPPGPVVPRELTAPHRQAGSRNLHPRDISQVHLLVGAQGLRYVDEERFGLAVLLNILSGGMSSRLFQSLREERGLVYTISGQSELYEETGAIGFYLACAPQNASEALDLIRRELEAVAAGDSMTAEELESAKEQLKGHLMLALESTFNRMSRLAKGLLFEGQVRTLEEVLRNIEAVTAEDLTRLAGEILDPEGLTVTMLGAVDSAANQGAAA